MSRFIRPARGDGDAARQAVSHLARLEARQGDALAKLAGGMDEPVRSPGPWRR